jgi:hypothetical protein
MRIKLLLGASFFAVIFLAMALDRPWASGMADDGTRFDVSLHGVSHVLHPKIFRSARYECTYLTGKGAVQNCAPSEQNDASFSMLCSVFPLVLTGLLLAAASALVTYVSPYRSKATSAALAAASLAAVFAGSSVAQIAMGRALKVFDEVPLYFDRFGFVAVWIAMACLLFAAALSTTSTMLKHD